MHERKRPISSVGAMPQYRYSSSTIERGRQQSAGAASGISSYSQRHLSAKSRASSTGARRTGGGGGDSVLGGRCVGALRTASAGRRQHSAQKIKSSVNGAVVTPDVKRVSFMKEGDKSSGSFLYSVLPPGTPGEYQSNNNSENGNPVQHLLSELVEISQTLATYLQDGPGRMMLQQRQTSVQNGNDSTVRQQQQQATLKAQEIERIVKRVESHFAQKIASMEQKEKEQAEKIMLLTKELYRLQQEQHHEPHQSRSPTFCSARPSGSQVTSLFNQHPTATAKGTATTGATVNNSPGENGLEAENLRRMLQEEKRQRLFVEEQTQSLTEQHSRVVSTLERRLQKQEEQLRELTASLDYQPLLSAATATSPGPRSPSVTRSLCLPASSTPRRLLGQQLMQHEQTQRALEAYRRSLRSGQRSAASPLSSRIDNNHKRNINAQINVDDNDGILSELASTGPKANLTNEVSSRGAAQGLQRSFSLEPPLTSSHGVNHQPLQQQQQQYTRKQEINLVDATASKAVEEVDEITAFLDNITQELESIDAMESERERQLTMAVGR